MVRHAVTRERVSGSFFNLGGAKTEACIRMNRGLTDKVALITAAASGIGRASAERFAAEGASVHAVDIDEAGRASLDG